ncbi:MAG: glycosyltransferase family 2 protein [Prevotella sp.]|nr:glycosyltransferase family 2 protein [Prevotella sp.]
MMKRELSVLIPVYEDDCREQVSSICRQLAGSTLERYEVIVADDGSKDRSFTELCREVSTLPHVRFIAREKNSGRACIRNFLAKEAKYEWLLFIDAELMPKDDQFIKRYIESEGRDVVCGDYEVGTCDNPSNLRYRYETAIASQHATDRRRAKPFHHFHTANFLIARRLMLAYPFDERFRDYGYEDVLFGKRLSQAGASIEHIDNPVIFCHFDTNERFVSKTEESLRTLHEFRNDLRGYSRMLTFVDGIHLDSVRWAIRLWHFAFGRLERRLLYGLWPRLGIFKAYKLGFFLSLKQNSPSTDNKK